MTSNISRLVLSVSDPPLSMAQLPLLMQSVEIWTMASGRASKITPMTPMGQVTRLSTRPWSSSRRSSTRPTGSGSETRLSMPAHTSASLCSSNSRRLRTAGATFASSAAARSLALAAKIRSLLSCSACLMRRRASLRASRLTEAISGLSSFM